MADENLMDLGAETDDQTPAPAEGGTTPEGQDPAPPSDGGGDKGEPATRPEFIPEKFWDAEKGQPRLEELTKSYGEAEKELTRLRKGEEVPENYDFQIPEEFKDKLEVDADDPMLSQFKEFAKEKKWGQARAQDAFEFFIKHVNGSAIEAQKAEIEALGGEKQAIETISRVRTFFKNMLTPEEYQGLQSTATTKEAVLALDAIRKRMSVQTPPPEGKTTVSDDLSDAQLRAMMLTEAYEKESHPDHHKVRQQVSEGFKKLYPPK